ncbi:MAG TPA: class I SAM-dependent methyltransferase [bacterium]|nr:class I SAM-dependent methyltransferase [bacterium]
MTPHFSVFGLDVSPASTTAVEQSNGRSRYVGTRLVETGCGSGALLAAGDTLQTPSVEPHPELALALRCSLARGDEDALLQVVLASDGDPRTIATLAVSHRGHPLQALLTIPQRNPVRIHVRNVSKGGAEVAVHQLLLAPRSRLGRANAFAGYQTRLSNELQHFGADSYRHAMYGSDTPSDAASRASDVREAVVAPESSTRPDYQCAAQNALASVSPEDGEVPFHFAMRALARLLPIEPPDFLERVNTLRSDGPIRMLSLCAGAARIEEMILGKARRPIELTLMDASRDLAERAAARLTALGDDCSVTTLIGDVNRGLPGQDSFDVILCVSALHHVADLETVLSQVNARLTDHGEFWSIGEQVGRNGNRLWPDDLASANAAFSELPPRLRYNHTTQRIDEALDDRDYSVGCFEGIRSEELEAMLASYLLPVDVYRRNVFLWRIVDATYGDNYDLSNPEDVSCLRRIIAAEASRWALGGVSTELHGVYRKKTLRTS